MNNNAPRRQSGIFVGLGSNTGAASDNLSKACALLESLELIEIVRRSNVYYTEPVDFLEQPWFANQVVEISVPEPWGAPELLARLVQVELEMGRRRTIRWGPRVIDLDLLLFGKAIINTEELTVPHPRMRTRAFVLVPLFDICPDLVFPNGDILREDLERLPYALRGERIYQHQYLSASIKTLTSRREEKS